MSRSLSYFASIDLVNMEVDHSFDERNGNLPFNVYLSTVAESEVLHNTNMVFPATNEVDMLPENYRNSNQIS